MVLNTYDPPKPRQAPGFPRLRQLVPSGPMPPPILQVRNTVSSDINLTRSSFGFIYLCRLELVLLVIVPLASSLNI